MKTARARSSRLLLAALSLLLPSMAFAAQYETEIEVEDELDLADLRAKDLIGDSTLETLLQMIRAPLDLNDADREELYQLPNLGYPDIDSVLKYRDEHGGRIGDLEELVTAKVLTPEQARQIRPFLRISPAAEAAPSPAAMTKPAKFKMPVSGRVRLQSAYAPSDPIAPPAFARFEAQGLWNLEGSVVLVGTRQRLGDIAFDPQRFALSAEPASLSVHVPKFYLRYRTKALSAVVGTYRIGFGQRLTLDNSSRPTPNGFYTDDEVSISSELSSFCHLGNGEQTRDRCTADEENTYVSPDFRWSDGFRGVAVSAKNFQLGGFTMSAHAFASYQSRSVYQYDLYSRATGSTPEIYEQLDDPTQPQAVYQSVTLPNLYDELAGGGNVTLKLGKRAHVGATAYYAQPRWSAAELELDFRPSARFPAGGPFGATGIDGAAHLGPLDLYAEVARSFDSAPGGGSGGWGAIQRTVASFSKQELELILRYYDPDFANPYTRASSSPDESEGNSARNEAGARLNYRASILRSLTARAQVDIWANPNSLSTQEAWTPDLNSFLRLDYKISRVFALGGWLDYRNKDVAHSGRCYDTASVCTGSRYRPSLRLGVEPFGELLGFALQYSHAIIRDSSIEDGTREDANAAFEVSSRPMKSLLLRGRVRWLSEDISSGLKGEESIWAYVDAAWRQGGSFTAQLRYDLYAYLDKRDSTAERIPSPEHRLRLVVEAPF